MTLTTASFVYKPAAALRGARDYYHSTDLYEEIVQGAHRGGLKFEGPIELRIKSRITRQPELRFTPSSHSPDNPDASCRFNSDGQPWDVAVTQGTNAIERRKSYDEGRIWGACRIERDSLVLETDTYSRPIETITALGVHLHKVLMPPPIGRRWYLAELLLSRPLKDEDARRVKITLNRALGHKTTRIRIDAADGPIGSMIFILN